VCDGDAKALAAGVRIVASRFGPDLPLFAWAGSVRERPRQVAPQYPALARKMSIKGAVKLEVVVEPDGSVKSITATGGHPLLVQAAQDAIRQWKWQSASHETLESIEVRFNPE